jgi:hypothetical protein
MWLTISKKILKSIARFQMPALSESLQVRQEGHGNSDNSALALSSLIVSDQIDYKLAVGPRSRLNSEKNILISIVGSP